MTEHDVDRAYRREIPVVACRHSVDGLVGVWVLPEVTVGHQSAVMVAQVLSVVVIVSTAVVGHDASVGKQSVALVHICTEVVIRREGVALDE